MRLSGTKRARPDESTDPSFPGAPDPVPLSSKHPTPSSFRNVSACNRCRLRKNRCDQNLPACASCEKAGVKCVGFDPLTKREIPRTYVYYLESRLNYLESLLTDHGIPFAPSQEFDIGSKPTSDSATGRSPPESSVARVSGSFNRPIDERGQPHDAGDPKSDESEKLNKLVSNIGMVSVQGTSDPRFLGSTSGISFARVVFAAVKSSISSTSSERGGLARSNAAVAAATNVPSMRDSFFGLQSKPAFKPAPFPDKKLALHLVNLYFEHANPQIPILHREDFMAVFEKAYAAKDRQQTPRELYMLNIVFAIGAGIIMDDPHPGRPTDTRSRQSMSPLKRESCSPRPKKHKPSNQQPQPEEYHASAIIHLESFLGSSPTADRPGGFGGGLEELQAVLLLAGFALLRPVAPGLWYISGVAVRLAVDLGLHYEGGADLDENGVSSQPMHRDGTTEVAKRPSAVPMSGVDERERGRREWVRDLRRRLWWCVYSFDRLVGVCVGRPVGISDAVITTDFPSILGDEDITPAGLSERSAEDFTGPSYKRVAHHYFRLRLIQSEILQVLQYRQAQKAHESKIGRRNQFMHTRLTSSFLQPFDSFHAWRRDIDRRLWEWKESAPLQKDTTVSFSVEFLELNYWQAVIMLYRQSLGVPPKLAGEVSPSEDVSSPLSMSMDGDAEDEDEIYLKVAEAGQRVLKLYRQLHRVHLVNYTYLATVHLFMAGIAFLYAIWHSATVRSRLTLDDVDFTVLAATSVLGDLIDKCPPAEACRDAFDRMSKATVQMCLSTTGFGSRVGGHATRQQHETNFSRTSNPTADSQPRDTFGKASRPAPQFDMNLRDLFAGELQDGRPFGSNLGRSQASAQSSLTALQQPSQVHAPLESMKSEQQYNFSPVRPTPPSAFIDSSMNDEPYNIDEFTNVDGLDFLLANNIDVGYHGQSGLNLGFEGQHDWADGTQLDMFDGFFFGGSGYAESGG